MKYLPMLLALFFVAAPLQAEPDSTPPKKTDAALEVALVAIRAAPMTDKQVSDLEELLTKYPDDLSARTKLLGYYFVPRPTTPGATESRHRHIFWVIKNRPEAEIAGMPFCQILARLDYPGYVEGMQLWQDQTQAHSNDATILAHAAAYLTIHDRAPAEDLLKQAIKLEPKNPKWHDQLGQLYVLGQLYPLPDHKQTDVKALAEFERAQALDTSVESQLNRRNDLAKAAFNAGDFEKARYYAEQLLQVGDDHLKDWKYGNPIHYGNIVLGRIALKEKKIKLANEYLLKAGQTPGSPTLNNFGPNMTLAKELLKAGQKKTVLQYFELCRKFWSGYDDDLDLWTKQVKAGRVPEFGANLVY